MTVIFGVGIDIVSVARMKKILSQHWADKFLRRVFASEEIVQIVRAINPEQGFAARFAAKEATAKALGTGFSKGIAPNQIMVVGGLGQKPVIILSSAAKTVAELNGIGNINVSISHTAGMACAIVVMEKI
ncbi:MAG: holo-ACP synthase [Desulfomonilaceae bacterium]